MASADARPGDRHLRKPIGYRVPADLWPLLDARKEETGQGPSAVITEALREYLARLDAAEKTEAEL